MHPFLTLHAPTASRDFYDRGLWTHDTFYSLLCKHAEERPSSMALRDAHHTLDWRSVKARVDAMSDDFLDRGIGIGDRVSVWMSNRIETVITFLACSRVGAVCNPSLRQTHSCAEVVALISKLRSSALVIEPNWGTDRAHHDFDAMLAELPFLKRVYKPTNFPLAITGVQEYLPETTHHSSDAVSYLAFTSGTTKPKYVMHSANTLLASSRELVRDWHLSSDDVMLMLNPVSHHITWAAAGQWLMTGASFVLDDHRHNMTQLDWIIESEATYALGAPTHAMDILHEQKKRELDHLGAIRTFGMTGAPIPETTAKALISQGIMTQNIYGIAESPSHHYTHPDDPQEIRIATCGRGGSAYEVKIWDPKNIDRALPPGHTGEIGGRGAALMLGYYRDQSAMDRAFNRHGFMMSGDLGSIDANGNLHVKGRIEVQITHNEHAFKGAPA